MIFIPRFPSPAILSLDLYLPNSAFSPPTSSTARRSPITGTNDTDTDTCRADGTPKVGRGRGRGRGGRGSRGGRGGGGGDRGVEGAPGDSAGGGTRTRGTATTRKPRVKKADRALMEAEKADREKMAVLVAKPAGYVGMGVLGGP